jgi:hypothetical protein
MSSSLVMITKIKRKMKMRTQKIGKEDRVLRIGEDIVQVIVHCE